jgi:SAM-dependent methyltransferase
MTLEPIDFYDARQWDVSAERPIQDREEKAIELLRAHTSTARGRLLDVGCGYGLFLRWIDDALDLSARDWRLTGVDYSEFTVETASRFPYEFARCNLEEGIPFEDGAFDVVYAGEVIEHLYNPDHLLEECRRVLRPGGRLVLSTPNLQAWYNRILFPLGLQPLFYESSTKSTAVGAGPLKRLKKGTVPVGHIRLMTRPALRDLLRQERFDDIRIQGAFFDVFPRPILAVDRLMTRVASLASVFVVSARRP